MPTFDETIEEYLGHDDDITDIRAMVRSAFYYDFLGYGIRVWQGQGKLFTNDGNSWLGTVNGDGEDLHKVPSISDGRDGSSGQYNMTLNLTDTPGFSAFEIYEKLKAEQFRVAGRPLTAFLVLLRDGEGLRPDTPIVFYKDFYMIAPKFSEKFEQNNAGTLVKKYSISIACKDGNYGRSSIPNGTYSDTIQKERALQQGIANDRGCEFVGLLANRTYVLE